MTIVWMIARLSLRRLMAFLACLPTQSMRFRPLPAAERGKRRTVRIRDMFLWLALAVPPAVPPAWGQFYNSNRDAKGKEAAELAKEIASGSIMDAELKNLEDL